MSKMKTETNEFYPSTCGPFDEAKWTTANSNTGHACATQTGTGQTFLVNHLGLGDWS